MISDIRSRSWSLYYPHIILSFQRFNTLHLMRSVTDECSTFLLASKKMSDCSFNSDSSPLHLILSALTKQLCSSPPRVSPLHYCTIVSLPTHRFTILHKVISTGASFIPCEQCLDVSLLLCNPLFRCLLADLPSYVNSSVMGVSFHNI